MGFLDSSTISLDGVNTELVSDAEGGERDKQTGLWAVDTAEDPVPALPGRDS